MHRSKSKVGRNITLRVRSRQLLFGILSVCCCAMTGCGYSLQGSGSILPPDVKRIYVPTVENLTTESGLSNVVTEALRDRFDRFGVVIVVEDVSEADAVLKAKVLKVEKDSRTVTSVTDTVQSYDTTMTIAAELRRVTGPVLWRNTRMQVSKAIGATSGDVVSSSADFVSNTLGASQLGALDSREVTRGQEREALLQLAEEVAKKVYDESVAPDF